MENISLKQWIVAGIKSGIIIGFLFFFLSFLTYTDISLKNISFLFTSSFVSDIFLGVIIGIILFFLFNKLSPYNKLPSKIKLLDCLFVSVPTVILIVVFSFLIFTSYLDKWENLWTSSLIPFSAIVYINLTVGYWFYGIIPGIGGLVLFNSLLIGITFGLLINYFINRTERKMRKNTGQT